MEDAVTEGAFREALGRLAKGVTVVTARRPDGTPSGLTATSVCSVSLDPPLVLACIERDTRTHGVLAAAGAYAVNVLREDQVELARLFSTELDQKFLEVDWEPGSTGAPLLVRAVVQMECAVVKTVPAGDHTIYVGEVRTARHDRDGDEPPRPLLYYRAAYHSLGPEDAG
jgi:flavin reductase (DIM6/NTAB) family NADH-FMN oxidoreductase RutF